MTGLGWATNNLLFDGTKEFRRLVCQIGRRIAAMYYLEQMYKADALGTTTQGLERVDAMWRFADSLCD